MLEILPLVAWKLRKGKEIENIQLCRDQIVEGEVRSNSDVVLTFAIIAIISLVKGHYIVAIFPVGQEEHRIVISLHIEENVVQKDISNENHCSVFTSWPPRTETEERFLVLVCVALEVWNTISQWCSFI